MAKRALATEAVMLSAPEWPQVPGCLRRASGESRYIPHGAARYATAAQLTMEERLLTHAQENGAPRLEPAAAAHLLGADQARLEAQLQAQTATPDAISELTGSGLRLDQAAAAYLVLTSARRAEVMAGPAGSGKTRTVAEMARIWQQAGAGEVIGLTTSQTARNVLAGAGVTQAYNTARFLGHLHGHREARGALPVKPGSLLILDEASMMSLADMAAILALAHDKDCKVVVTGDHEQLTAVEGGGGMMLLARRQGCVQLAEPQRFTNSWERDATLRLRAGDTTVLASYEEHGRLRGGTPEEATEQAYRAWLADYLDGTDTLLMARTEDQARELSRRARDDLIRYGIVSVGPHTKDCPQANRHRTKGGFPPGTQCRYWPPCWPGTAASGRRRRPCTGNCPAPTTWACSARSGTTWPARPKPPGSSTHCARPCPPASPTRPSTTRRARGCGGPSAKPKPPASTAAKSCAKPWRHGAWTAPAIPPASWIPGSAAC
jgi:AAA domain-containing protein